MSNQGQFVPFSESKTPEQRSAWVEAQRALGNKVKKGYDNTQINPFKIPDKIEITHKIDIVGTYGEFFKWFSGLTPKEVEKIADTLAKNGKMIESVVKKRFK